MPETRRNVEHANAWWKRAKEFAKATKSINKEYKRQFGDIRIRLKMVWLLLPVLDSVERSDNSKEKAKNRESIENACKILDVAEQELATLTSSIQTDIDEVRAILTEAKSALEE